jgi:hypothetical protein
VNKIKEFISDHINKALAVLAAAALAGFATVGYWFCKLLGVNGIYCEPLIIRSELFLFAGILLSLALRRKWLFLAAIALAIILLFVAHIAPLPRTPEEIIEFAVVVPFQFVIGVIFGEILIWIWTRFGSIFKAKLRKALGLP